VNFEDNVSLRISYLNRILFTVQAPVIFHVFRQLKRRSAETAAEAARPRKCVRADISDMAASSSFSSLSCSAPVATTSDFPSDLLAILEDDSLTEEMTRGGLGQATPVAHNNDSRQAAGRGTTSPVVTKELAADGAANPVVAQQYRTRDNPLYR
jgi:hypothetical protein